jgi:excisionase family DNA binding protein
VSSIATVATRATEAIQIASSGRVYLTSGEVAARWSVTPRTIQRMAVRGELRSLRVGRALRIAVEDIEAYEARQGAGGGL